MPSAPKTSTPAKATPVTGQQAEVRLLDSISPQRHALNVRRRESPDAYLFDLLDAVKDPEIPVLSIWQLGILQDVYRHEERVTVVITPTYSGCPATSWISQQIVQQLQAAGFAEVAVEVRLAPAWSTDWLERSARRVLREYGIAGPQTTACPQCGSQHTRRVSEFGSTPCKALWQCLACQEPFDYFKPL
ncbi:MAG: 1,2-phenylacetyl-CoA epoxidase subunit PaaD [Pseudomonadota bacterium]